MKLFSFLSKGNNVTSDSFSIKIGEHIGYFPEQKAFFTEAITHKSINSSCNYERLEFLGDSILDAAVSKYIFSNYRSLNEGELTLLRSKLVSRKNLNKLGKKLKLEELINSSFDKEEIPENMFGNVLEALVGAIYLDGGQEVSDHFIKNNLLIDLSVDEFHKIENYKGKLLEWGTKEKKQINFLTTSDNIAFKSELTIDNELICEAKGNNKKSAEQKASSLAIIKLNIILD